MIPDTAIPPMPGEVQERPPHVEFELEAIEDRAASQKAGSVIMVDQEFAMIYPRGGKDMVRKRIPNPPEQGTMPSMDYQEFRARFGRQYDAWKAGMELPVEGTDLRQFRMLTPAQIENCRTFHILTVEQLAEANEETLQNIGMGSRNWQSMAKRYLEFGDNGGKELARIEDLEVKNQSLTDLIEKQASEIEELRVKLGEVVPSNPPPVTPKNGRRKKRGK